MPLQNTDPTTTKTWKTLLQHFEQTKDHHLKDLFAEDPDRAKKFTREWQEFLVDFSKNRITKNTFSLLLELAEEVGLQEAIEAYFGGDPINKTENRAVLHTALRAHDSSQMKVEGYDVMPEVLKVREEMRVFSEAIISGKKKGYSGKSFKTVVNIGIGGSDLGPAMVVEALQYYRNHLDVHFVSNIDGDHVHETLKKIDPETTLFVIVSKSFGTQETLSNATTIKNWFLQHASEKDIATHFVAVSTNIKKVTAFGISADNIFPMWDWVGGRFSLWSAVGLTISLAIGFPNFRSLLQGAEAMDQHFRNTSFEDNIPVILALLSVWYNNFFNAETEAVIPYNQYLSRLAAYLQQAVMESNGKCVDRNGRAISYQTGTIVWGEPGTNSQHAFFQLIHQGTKLIPADFIGFKESLYGDKEHHNKLMANFFAQTEALMNGKNADQVQDELAAKGSSVEEIDRLTPFKVFEGNKPSTTILIKKLTPKSLGALIALYEHKIFVQGVVWNIFSYDQWGVELGKQLATKIQEDLHSNVIENHDTSTQNLLRNFKD